jgi:hypothetical protein
LLAQCRLRLTSVRHLRWPATSQNCWLKRIALNGLKLKPLLLPPLVVRFLLQSLAKSL